MVSAKRYVIFAAIFIQLLMVSAVASPLTNGLNPLGDFTKMNTDLQEEIESSDDSKIIPVIFQLNSPMNNDDINDYHYTKYNTTNIKILIIFQINTNTNI